jgi:hypothetical protein
MPNGNTQVVVDRVTSCLERVVKASCLNAWDRQPMDHARRTGILHIVGQGKVLAGAIVPKKQGRLRCEYAGR